MVFGGVLVDVFVLSARVFLFVECFYWFTGGENRLFVLMLCIFAMQWMGWMNGWKGYVLFCCTYTGWVLARLLVLIEERRKNNEIFSVYINFHFLLWRIYLLWWMLMVMADSNVFLSALVILSDCFFLPFSGFYNCMEVDKAAK